MKHKYKLIAVDLDGTLLNSDHQIPPIHLEALQQAKDKGLDVIIATGKTPYSAPEVYSQLGFHAPGVFSQGLILLDQNSDPIYEQSLPDDVSRVIVDYCLSEDLFFVAYKGNEIVSIKPSAMDDLLAKYHEPPTRHTHSAELLFAELPVQKILIHGGYDELREKRPEIELNFGHLCDLVFGNPVMLEFVPLQSSKGDGLMRMIQYMGIDRSEVIAFGDGENDLEMIKMAGLGIAMENGNDELKEAANFITRSNDAGGIAFALHHFQIIELNI